VQIHPLVEASLFAEALLRGGYRYERDDLSLDEWIVIGMIADEREALRWQKSDSGSSSPPRTSRREP
jgi:hypothetical protein